jgi:hypothetical protein
MYKLTVSPNSNMSNPVLEDSTGVPSYEVTEELTNGVYYWQSASRQGATWTASAVHSFTLEGGWTQLEYTPVEVSYGASLAYEKDFYSNDERLLALVGNGSSYYYTYSVAEDTWYEFTTPKAQGVGSAIVTHEAASSTPPDAPGPWAVFGENSDSLYNLTVKFGWQRFGYAGEFPQSLGPGASLAYSVESGVHYLYLIVGQDGNGDPRNDFYRQELPGFEGGGQAVSTHPASAPARLITGPDRVTVEYQLSAPAEVKATVFDAVGRQMGVLFSGPQPAGIHQLCWVIKASDRRTSPGAYFVLLDTGTEQARLKAVVR